MNNNDDAIINSIPEIMYLIYFIFIRIKDEDD